VLEYFSLQPQPKMCVIHTSTFSVSSPVVMPISETRPRS